MPQTVDVSRARAGLSDLLSRVLYQNERIVLRRRGRPLAALVPLTDLAALEQRPAKTTRKVGEA